jgi:poly(3-hydroxybutyrate) depolymerase
MNDLDSNLALMLTPSQQAAYERAVIQAMLDAGIGPDVPVMLTGWSQGGILAGKMAADPNSPFNIQAIYVSGAPIDSMNIPDSVSVISVQHTDDPVTKLDSFTQPGHQGPNWVTVTQDPPLDKKGNPMEQHDSISYAGTGDRYVDQSSDPRVNEIKDKQDMFFSDHEVVHIYEGSEQPVPLPGQR